MLSAGAQNEIRIFLPGGIHYARYRLNVDVLRPQQPLLYTACQDLHPPHDLLPAAIVDSHVEYRTGVAAGFFLDIVHLRLVFGGQRRAVAQKHHTVVLLLVIVRHNKVFAEQLHNAVDFLHRTRPVLGGKRIKRDAGDLQLVAVADDIPKHLCAPGVARSARQAAFFGPAAVPVHDDSDAQTFCKAWFMCHNALDSFVKMNAARAAARHTSSRGNAACAGSVRFP